jgi:hypothetical protein
VAIISGPTGGHRCHRYGALLKRRLRVRSSRSRFGSSSGTPGPGVARELQFKSHFKGEAKFFTDATTGGARPTREDALRWVHDNAMGDGSCAPLTATLAGDVLRTAAAYTFWKAARKLRCVCKGIRTGGGLEARPQAAAGGAREAATPTANAAGLQPAQDDGAKTTSSLRLLAQQPGPCRHTEALSTAAKAEGAVHVCATGAVAPVRNLGVVTGA